MKEPKKHLTKKEAAEMFQKQKEAQAGKKIVREILYPILYEHASTIRDAERKVQIFKTVITVIMQKPFKEKTIGDLDFTEEMEKDDEKSRKVFKAFVDGFKDVPIGTAMKILDELEGGINAYFDGKKNEEFKTLTITDLIGE